MNRKNFQDLSRVRLAEAKSLLRLGHFSGVYHVAGYAIECALKACIAKQTMRHGFPDKERARDSYEHSPKRLRKVAELDALFVEAVAANPKFGESWTVVEQWSEQSRYGVYSREEANALLRTITEKRSGVLPWIQRHW